MIHICQCGCGTTLRANYRGKFYAFARGHYQKEKRPKPLGRPHLCNGYVMLYAPLHPRAPKAGYMAEHILIAEAALGRLMQGDEQIHHFNENRADNRHDNLVICPGVEYHQLLHRRQRALMECGNANWRKCTICKQWDAPEYLYIHGKLAQHRACHAAYQLRRSKS